MEKRKFVDNDCPIYDFTVRRRLCWGIKTNEGAGDLVVAMETSPQSKRVNLLPSFLFCLFFFFFRFTVFVYMCLHILYAGIYVYVYTRHYKVEKESFIL